MKIESKTVTIKAKNKEIFEFITNLNNFESLLPAERISEWESTETYCSFKVQGTATIDLQLKESTPYNHIVFESGSRSPFPFTLNVYLNESGDVTTGYQVLDAKVNPFLKMMIEKPLTNLFDYIADKLAERYEG